MAASEHGGTIKEADVTSFVEKLDAWARDLTPVEQTLLNRLIERAASAEPEPADTHGHIIIVNSLPQNILLVAGQPSPLLQRAVGLSDIVVVKTSDSSSPGLFG